VTGQVIDDSALRLRILAEYREMPGLRLSADQAARLLGLQPEFCVATLDGLVADGRLGRSARGEYLHVWRRRIHTAVTRGALKENAGIKAASGR